MDTARLTSNNNSNDKMKSMRSTIGQISSGRESRRKLQVDGNSNFTVLVDGIPSDPFDGASDGATTTTPVAVEIFTMVPAMTGNVTCETQGTNGDVDFIMFFDEAPGEDVDPSLFVWSQPNGSPPNEIASLPLIGDVLFVGVYTNETFTDLILTCTSSSGIIALEDGVPSAPFSLATNASHMFAMVPAFTGSVTCETQGVNGDADFVMFFDEFPSADADPASFQWARVVGSNDIATLPIIGNVLIVVVSAYEGFTDVTLTCTSVSSSPEDPDRNDNNGDSNIMALLDGVTSEPFSLASDPSQQLFAMIPTLTGSVTCVTQGNNGDADFTMFFDEFPADDADPSSFVQAALNGSNETGTLPVIGDNLFVFVSAYQPFTDLVLTCTSSADIPDGPLNQICCTSDCMTYFPQDCPDIKPYGPPPDEPDESEGELVSDPAPAPGADPAPTGPPEPMLTPGASSNGGSPLAESSSSLKKNDATASKPVSSTPQSSLTSSSTLPPTKDVAISTIIFLGISFVLPSVVAAVIV